MNKEVVVALLKAILSLLSVITLSFWILQVVVPVIYYFDAGGHLPTWYVSFAIFPIVYLLFCLNRSQEHRPLVVDLK